MNVSRNFLVIGALYLIGGMLLGSWMSVNEKFLFTPVHAHMNLLGFALMSIFGLAYRLIPKLTSDWMAAAHFWLHQIGVLIFVVFLYLLLSESLARSVAGPILGIAEVIVILGTLTWLVNLWRNLGD